MKKIILPEKNSKPKINLFQQPLKQKIWGFCYKILFLVIFLFGLFAILITSHEVYHLHNGTPTGVCLGNCLNNNSVVFSTLFFNETFSEDYLIKEENNAWTFSLIFTALIFFLFCVTKSYGEEK